MPHCQVCLCPLPHHAVNCPVLTGAPVQGELAQQEQIKSSVLKIPRESALAIWNASWEACLSTERMRAKLEADEGFACEPREWCFEQWAFNNGYPPAPTIL